MTRLYEKLRPTTLADVIGQPQVTGPLSAFLLEPYPNIFLCSGPTGTGKTCVARILSAALTEPDGFGDHVMNGAMLKTEAVEKFFVDERPYRYRTLEGKFHVLRIEEFERMPPNVQNFLKEALEEAQRRYRLIVVATSNTTAAIKDKALLHRFQRYDFDAGPAFAAAFNEWLQLQWLSETGDFPPPAGWQTWGIDFDRLLASGDSEFSGRLALDKMEQALAARLHHRDRAQC